MPSMKIQEHLSVPRYASLAANHRDRSRKDLAIQPQTAGHVGLDQNSESQEQVSDTMYNTNTWLKQMPQFDDLSQL